MSWCYAFRWQPGGAAGRTSILVIAAVAAAFDEEQLRDTIDEDYKSNLLPDQVLIILPAVEAESVFSRIEHAAEDRAFLRIAPDHVALHVAFFDTHGRCAEPKRASGPETNWQEDWFDQLKTAGLRSIFERRGVLMEPETGVHFEHPRGVHSRGFLRTANALVSGAEIDFVALTLLRHLGPETNRIWLDTSSIASVAYAMAAIRQRFEPKAVPLQVGTFSSYEGLRRTRFVKPTQSLFIISATASGGLARELMRLQAIGKERVVNIYSGAPQAADVTVECDVADHPRLKNRDGRSVLEVFAPDACPWCREGNRLVRFVNDQFLADAVRYEAVPILAADAPPGLAAMAERFAGRGVFTIKRVPASRGHKIWLDLASLTGLDPIKRDLERAIQRYAPISTSHVIHLEDDDSRRMASRVAGIMRLSLNREPHLVPVGALRETSFKGATAVVVVAACIGSGNSLLEISRELRDVLKDGPRIYVLGFAKNGDDARYPALVNDLAFNRTFRHEVVPLHRLVMPGSEFQAWRLEENFLKSFREADQGEQGSDDVPTFVGRRLATLAQTTFEGGHDLFLPDASGRPLALRDGFAFWNDKTSTTDASQGDVAATIASVLHGMRVGSPRQGREPKLWARAFHVMLIEPGMFGRYNDGVIQAALLRTAFPDELNFGARRDLSGAMTRLISRALDRWDTPQGEAVMEFLLALGTGRLVLQADDVQHLTSPEGAPMVLERMLAFVKSKLAT